MDCNSPARVVVDGTEVPYINEGVHVEMRKGGPADLTRVADVRVPAAWQGESYVDTIGASPDSSGYKNARVEVRTDDGSYVTVMNGFVLSVGGGGGSQRELRMRIGDPAKFLPSVPISASFFADDDVIRASDVLATVREEYTTEIDVFDDIGIVADDASTVISSEATYDGPSDIVTGPDKGVTNGKRFTENRDSLYDVMEWISEVVGGVYYFEPTDPPTLHLTTNPHTSHEDERLGGDVEVRSNDALSEIRPVNTLELDGAAARRIELGPITGNFGDLDNQYPHVVVRSENLYERANEQEVKRTGESKKSTVDGLVNEATRRLKKLTDTKSGGSMDLALAPAITPYDRLDALPGCRERVDTDVPTIEYEVERLRHMVSAPTEQYQNPYTAYTEIECSLFVQMNDITVVTKEKLDTE